MKYKGCYNKIPNYDLTKSESNILNLVYQGLSRKEIAEKLCIAKQSTLKTHLYTIYLKKKVHSMEQLLVLRIKELEEKLNVNKFNN